MSDSMLAVVVLAMLASVALWFSLRMAGSADLAMMPAGCRRRVYWWQAHAGYCYLGCAVLAALVLGARLQGLVV